MKFSVLCLFVAVQSTSAFVPISRATPLSSSLFLVSDTAEVKANGAEVPKSQEKEESLKKIEIPAKTEDSIAKKDEPVAKKEEPKSSPPGAFFIEEDSALEP